MVCSNEKEVKMKTSPLPFQNSLAACAEGAGKDRATVSQKLA
jgi:hypothetical protein